MLNLYQSSYGKQFNAKNYKEPKKYYMKFNIKNIKFFNSIITQELNLPENKNINFSSKTLELFSQMFYYDYCNNKLMMNDYYENLNDKDKYIFLDKIFYFYELDNDYLKFNFNHLPYSTKKYREFIKKEIDSNLSEENLYIYENNKNQSIIYETIKNNLINSKEKDKILSLCFDYLSTLDNIFLYNLSDENIDDLNEQNKIEFLDKKYLRYIENKNSKQKVNLICIIDRYKHNEHINNIIYPYINELYFTLFSNTTFDEHFMFSDLPIKDIYSIFITYFLTIQNYQNIKKYLLEMNFL